jgi:tetratricopeptide (TPR) repeat protein
VIYFTFNPETSGSRTEVTLASVILGQLLAEPTLKDLVLSALMKLYRDRPDEMQVSFREVLQILFKTCEHSRRCYLVLDGLDEMAESTTTKTRLLRALLDFQQEYHAHNLKTIVVSRDVTPFREILSFDLSLQIRPKHTESDVMTFARLHLSRMALPDSIIDLASVAVQQRSHGLFIWASLFISGLQIESNEKGDLTSYVVEAEEGLSSLYAHAMLQLHRSSPELLELRKLALTFCATADVPLDLTEIDDAIRFGLNCRMDTVEIVHKACGPFVDVTDGKVSLCHLSIRDYVLATDRRGNNIFLPDSQMAAHATMATICLGYLCLDDHQQPFSCVPWHDYQESGQFPFLRYVCLNWERHMRHSGPLDPKFLEMLRKFFTSNAGIRWATCYHPHFQRKMGESHISAIGELRSVLLRVKNSLLRNASTDTRYPSLNAEICQALDTFLVQAFETVLAVERSLAGTKSRSTIERLLELSRVLRACGSPKQAQLTAREASSIATVRFGVMDPLSLMCTHHNFLLELNNIPMNMHSVSKKDILQGLRDLSFSMNEVLGRYHPETLRCYHDMGLALFRNQQVKESYNVLKRVYEDMRKHLGPSRLTQRTVNNLANALYTLRRLDEAESILLSIEDVQQLSGGAVSVELDSYHIYSFEALALLANVYLQQIQPGKAVPLHERAIAGRALLVGYDAELFLWVKNLGLTLMYQKEFGKSSSLYVLWIFNGRKNIQSGKSVAMLRECLVECLEIWKSASRQGLYEAPIYDEKVTAALDQSLDKDPLVLSVGAPSPSTFTLNEGFYSATLCFFLVLALYICTSLSIFR